MIVKNLVSVGVTALLLSAGGGATSAAAQQAKSLSSDSLFILKAASVGLLQVKLAELAEKKGSSPAVVEFGKRMGTEYSKTNEEFKAAAKQAAFAAPVMLRQDQQILDRFKGTGRSSFDKAYMGEMVRQHNEEVKLFQQESASGRVQSLKQLASRMLPEIEQRLGLATQTAGSVGVDVTASSSPPGEGSATY
jgi:putative membrane protein